MFKLIPIITEKSLAKTSKSCYTFMVAKTATKGQIQNVVESVFKVKVIKISTLSVPNKTRRKGRYFGVKSGFKKATVSLKEGQKIPGFEISEKGNQREKKVRSNS